MGMDPGVCCIWVPHPRLILITAQEEDDEKAHLLCADGAIFQASKGGKFSSTVLPRTTHDLEISVYT